MNLSLDKIKNLDKSIKYIISPEISEFRRFSPKLKIGVMASGKGSNFQELINLSEKGELDIDIKVLITNKDDAGCIKRAESVKIPHKIIRGKDFSQKELFELEIINTLINYDVELIVFPPNLRLPVSTNAGNIFVVPVASLNVIFAASCDVLVD